MRPQTDTPTRRPPLTRSDRYRRAARELRDERTALIRDGLAGDSLAESLRMGAEALDAMAELDP